MILTTSEKSNLVKKEFKNTNSLTTIKTGKIDTN